MPAQGCKLSLYGLKFGVVEVAGAVVVALLQQFSELVVFTHVQLLRHVALA